VSHSRCVLFTSAMDYFSGVSRFDVSAGHIVLALAFQRRHFAAPAFAPGQNSTSTGGQF
jgi:hypothetical protein